MILYYKEKRDREFFDLCMKIKQGSDLSVEEVVKKAILMPASSFFLTEKGYERIISYKKDIKGVKCQLYEDVKEAFKTINTKKRIDAYDILDQLPAPRFYMSVSRGVSLYYELIKKYNNEVRHRIDFYNRVFGV